MDGNLFDIKFPDKDKVENLFKLHYSTLGATHGSVACIIWGSETQYAKLSYNSSLLNKRVYLYCHNLSYFYANGKFLKKEGKTIYDISHLCHRKGCVNASHLIRETRSTNESRKLCSKQGCCTTKHTPSCIFPSKLLEITVFGIS